MDKIILTIDTSSENLGVAIYNATTDKNWSFSEVAFRNQAAKLNVVIENLLQESSYKFSDLSAIAVTKGPGSFTGVRIAIATAKGFALALDIPILTCSTLEVVATSCVTKNCTVWLTAHGGDVYTQNFTNGKAVDKPQAIKVAEATAQLPKAAVLCGNGAMQYNGELQPNRLVENNCMTAEPKRLDRTGNLPQNIPVSEKSRYVNPATLAKLAWQKHQNGDKSAQDLSPLYVSKLSYQRCCKG